MNFGIDLPNLRECRDPRLLAQIAGEAAAWWSEGVWSWLAQPPQDIERMRRRIRQGPPRADYGACYNPTAMGKPFHVISESVLLEFRREPEGGYTVTVPTLPGCLTYGESFEEALGRVNDAITGWLGVAKEEGFPIPEQFQELAQAS